jgi:predicted AlkP superfamily pyrophosphatase or phosphodiesterase
MLVVFVDALGPDQLARMVEHLPALEHRAELGGILGYSSGALASVLTGSSPADHGRMCLFTHKADEAPSILRPLRWLGLLPRVVHERDRVRRAAARLLAKRAGLTGYVALHRVPPEAFEWLDLPERDDLFEAEAVGEARTFLADARSEGLGVYASPWQLSESERWEHAHRSLREQRPDLSFLYSAELDAALHAEGNDGGAAERVMERIAAHIEQARDELGSAGAITTIVVGDHGMADVHRYVDPRPVLAQLPVRVFVDSTMLRLWGSDRDLDAAHRFLESRKWPGRWLHREALASRLAPTARDAYGRAMFVLEEGTIFAPSFVGGRVKGMHGYDLSGRSTRAAIACDRPIPGSCLEITDVAGLVRRRLGIESEGSV